MHFIGCLLLCLILTSPALSFAQADDPAEETKGSVPMGVHRVTDEKGRSWIIYSTGSDEKADWKARAEEDRKNSWEMLKAIIIDARENTGNSNDSTEGQ